MRLVFIVEGATECHLINKLVIPYLNSKGIQMAMHAQTITTNRKQHKKGGIGSYEKFRNEVLRTLAQGNVLVTSCIDFFRLPTSFPSFDTRNVDQIEQGIADDIGAPNFFLPYIQMHEVEALMFSSPSGLQEVTEHQELAKIQAIIDTYQNPEEINSRPECNPSTRLENIFTYKKAVDSEIIFAAMDIAELLEKCPRFKAWLHALKDKLLQYPN